MIVFHVSLSNSDVTRKIAALEQEIVDVKTELKQAEEENNERKASRKHDRLSQLEARLTEVQKKENILLSSGE